jgi:hypothetical protein
MMMNKKPNQSSLPIENISALAELERLGVTVEMRANNEVQMICPVHEDTNPSLMLDTQKNLFKCQSCKARGDIVSLLAHFAKVDRAVMLQDLGTRYDLGLHNTLDPRVAERFHEGIWSAGPLLQALYSRGVTDSMIRKARLGFHNGRIMIPVYDEQRRIVNIRRYLPGAPGPQKMYNTKGYGTPPNIYQIEQLVNFKKSWMCGGEMKALVAGTLLTPNDVGAWAVCAGEGSWEASFGKHVKGKTIYICFDIDHAGMNASRSVAKQLAHIAEAVYIVRLPLDREKFPKGDINDYVASTGATAQDLLRLMEEAELYVPEKFAEEEEPKDAQLIKLAEASRSNYIGKRIAVDAMVQAMDTTPYLLPQNVDVQCTRDQPNCEWCPVKASDPDEKTGLVHCTVRGTAIGILDIVQSPKGKQREALREALNIPKCNACEFFVRSHTNAYDIRLMPQLETTGSNSDYVVQPAFLIGDYKIETNTPYVFKGRVHPHPKNQQAILLFNEIGESRNSLDAFAPTPEQLEEMDVFKSTEYTVESITEKLDAIYTDMEANVTRIYKRRELHLVLDLMYHSILYLTFDERKERGWVNVVIVGDSSQGKSEASQAMMKHYRLGERIDCKNATVAGVLGGCEQIGNHWFISWGTIPIHDRRAVLLEEVKGAPLEVISKLTDMRSSGIAEIQKIEKRRAHARTRLAFISNARGTKSVDDRNFGCEVIEELAGSKEDVRRFDVGILLSSSQVDPSTINQLIKDRPRCHHIYTSDLCNRLVLWAWTRTADQVIFDPEAIQACLTEANRLAGKFSEELPLIDKGTTKFKLARLAAGLAGRLFSTVDGDRTKLRVTAAHVHFIAQTIDGWYSDKVFGYLAYSQAQEYKTKIKDPHTIRAQIMNTRFPSDLVDGLLNRNEIQLGDFQDWCQLDRDGAQSLLSFLVRKHALNREKRYYVKSGQFIEFLKKLQTEDIRESQPLPGSEF